MALTLTHDERVELERRVRSLKIRAEDARVERGQERQRPVAGILEPMAFGAPRRQRQDGVSSRSSAWICDFSSTANTAA
jgi:hypothetical protein